MQKQPLQEDQEEFNLTGLSVPSNNPYKKLNRIQLIGALKRLQTRNKQLTTRLAFLEPEKQRQPICGTLQKRNALFRDFQVKKYCLRIAYIGISYNGFIAQSSTDNTIEHFLFKCLYACNLIQNKEPGEDYTRAGRTDRGVSAFGNVIALNLRTSTPKSDSSVENKLQSQYCRMLNANLPTDIRILSCQEVSNDFNARYSCTQREYKYFFLKSFLDLDRMKEAIASFQGTHNFINFCRIDVVATTNHERTIRKARIEKFQPWETIEQDARNQVYYFHFVGNAFLWHQIRFMATILFMVGSHKEQTNIVAQMLDTKLFPRKPNYPISPEYPLILQNCKYDKHQFVTTQENVIQFYNSFLDVLMRRTVDLHLYIACISNLQSAIQSHLSIQTHELVRLATEEDSKTFKTKAKKKLNLQKPSCINVQEAISNLTGKRLDLFDKRMQKQAEYQDRIRGQAPHQD